MEARLLLQATVSTMIVVVLVNISIKAQNITLINGGDITTSTQGGGRGGNIFLDIDKNLQLSGTRSSSFPSIQDSFLFGETNIFAVSSGQTNDAGNAGVIDIKAENLLIKDFATIGTSTFGPGNSGTINIDIKKIDS